MLQFKTVALPATTITVKDKAMYTVETANKVLAPIGQRIMEEAKGGWDLHSYVVIPATVHKKIGIFGKIIRLFTGPRPGDTIHPEYYSLIFKKEV